MTNAGILPRDPQTIRPSQDYASYALRPVHVWASVRPLSPSRLSSRRAAHVGGRTTAACAAEACAAKQPAAVASSGILLLALSSQQADDIIKGLFHVDAVLG